MFMVPAFSRLVLPYKPNIPLIHSILHYNYLLVKFTIFVFTFLLQVVGK